ncbi:S41 family peptidase [Rhabdochromatium marinum]|uniref:S41 family peptidase n=1 Tax=Rhabdochromatium marinum TaxID=48729 RepID=UPI001903A387|nr:S41 family peptidase [Rhabdochromatium marinum]MBK1650255.1 hypothetical protein [Rhabdochromatium marinum]
MMKSKKICSLFLTCLFQLSIFIFFSTSVLAEDTYVPASPMQIFENFWQEAKSKICTIEREKEFFTEENYQILKKKVKNTNNIYELTPVINHFLKSLQISHTQFYDNHTIDFYMFRSMFSTRDITLPKVNHIGTQYAIIDNNYVVREVLDGYPAAIAGIRRGDILLEANGKPFHPYNAFNPNGKNIQLKLLRNQKILSLNIDAVNENPNNSFYKAMLHSKRVYDLKGKKIGYIHLWSGTHNTILSMFTKIISSEFHDKDGIILDLRGGFGGAWYDYLDPFFPDRKNFFEYTVIDRKGKSILNKPDLKTNPSYFSGPMVVLINEGVRSGKEALAYQFKKSNRATLIGTKTKGAFSAGTGIFNEEKQPYFLFLATAELLLDGNKVEGFGISPTIQIPYPLKKSTAKDPQLEAALLEIGNKI